MGWSVDVVVVVVVVVVVDDYDNDDDVKLHCGCLSLSISQTFFPRRWSKLMKSDSCFVWENHRFLVEGHSRSLLLSSSWIMCVYCNVL